MQYRLKQRGSDSVFFGGEWEPLAFADSEETLEEMLEELTLLGYELCLERSFLGCDARIMVYKDPIMEGIPNPVKPCPYGLRKEPTELLWFTHVLIEEEPRVYNTLRDYVFDAAH